jgi:hypothetical protein
MKKLLLSLLLLPSIVFGQAQNTAKDADKHNELGAPTSWKTTRTGNYDVPFAVGVNPDGSTLGTNLGNAFTFVDKYAAVDKDKKTEFGNPVNWKTTRVGNYDVPIVIVTNPDGSNIAAGGGGGGSGTVTSVAATGANGIGVTGSPVTTNGTLAFTLPFTLAGVSTKTLTVNNTLTFTGTDASSVAFGAGGTVLYNGGALGTPSSGTLTNATGLPVSGIVSSTSTALGLGSIELGHASDTTISRVSAGVIAVEGVNVLLNGGALGTPSSATLTNATGLPVSGITASTTSPIGVGSIELGHATDTTLSRASAGVLAVEGVNVLLNGGALGTPSSGTLTNATGLPISGLVASTSAALGVGTIELGNATDTTISRVSGGQIAVEGVNVIMNGGALGTPSSGTLTNATGLPVAGITASTTTALGVGSIELGHATDTTLSRSAAGQLSVEGVVVPTISSTSTLTNKTITPRENTTASSSSITINSDATDIYTVTALAADTTFNAPSGTPTQGQRLMIRIKDNGTARALTFSTGSSGTFRASSDLAFPSTTIINKTLYLLFVYNTTDSRWDFLASLNNF